MKKNTYSIFTIALAMLLSSWLSAQSRYTAEIFSEVQVQKDVVYGNNVSILTGAPTPTPLLADVYTPVGDTETDRPVVLVAHTGSFLPPLLNQTPTGDRGDSTLVEVCTRLAKSGYVAIAFTYRLGWVPTSPNADVRKGSLLQAAYRGIQDARTAIRFVKKSVAEDGNPFGCNPEKIAVWGIGTGGYLSAGAATLDDYEEVILEKFLDANNLPLADTALLGNFYATTEAPLCIPNHVGYSSDFQLSINMGGAMGDLSWVDGDGTEPPMVGVHCPSDIFAPYYIGNVSVPTTGELVIEDAAGTRAVIGEANANGSNDLFLSLTQDEDPLQARVNLQKQASFSTPGGDIPLGVDNMYAFMRPGFEGSPWDWWDENVIRTKVAFLNTQGFSLDADLILQGALATNPDMSAQKARTYIDTVFQLVTPRMCLALDLGCELGNSVREVPASVSGLTVGPNPASDFTTIRTDVGYPIQSVMVYDMNGRLVRGITDILDHNYELLTADLPAGLYSLRVQFEEGVTLTRLAVQ